MLYIVTSNYFDSGIFGAYASARRARLAFEHFLKNNLCVVSHEDIGHYCYRFIANDNKTYIAEIIFCLVDKEFNLTMNIEEG